MPGIFVVVLFHKADRCTWPYLITMDGVLLTFPLYVWRNWRQSSFSGSELGVYWRWDKAGAIDLDSLVSACPLLSDCLMLVHLLLDIWPRKEMFAVRSGLRWHSILFPCRPHSHTTVMLASVHPEVLISSQPPVPKSLPHTQSYLPHFSSACWFWKPSPLLHTGVRSLLQLPRHQD